MSRTSGTSATAGPLYVGVSTKMYLGYQASLRWLSEVRAVVDARPALAAGRDVRVFVIPSFPVLARGGTDPGRLARAPRRPELRLGGRGADRGSQPGHAGRARRLAGGNRPRGAPGAVRRGTTPWWPARCGPPSTPGWRRCSASASRTGSAPEEAAAFCLRQVRSATGGDESLAPQAGPGLRAGLGDRGGPARRAGVRQRGGAADPRRARRGLSHHLRRQRRTRAAAAAGCRGRTVPGPLRPRRRQPRPGAGRSPGSNAGSDTADGARPGRAGSDPALRPASDLRAGQQFLEPLVAFGQAAFHPGLRHAVTGLHAGIDRMAGQPGAAAAEVLRR